MGSENTKCAFLELVGERKEAAVGFEPTITDLQSVAAKPQAIAKQRSYQKLIKPLALLLAHIRLKVP